VASRNDVLIERDQREVKPAAASIALQRRRIRSIGDDWSVMTDDEKKRLVAADLHWRSAPSTLRQPVVEFR